MNVLVLNAGSASLKFEVISALANEDALNSQTKLVSGAIENIGEEATFSLLKGKQVISKEPIDANDYGKATEKLLIGRSSHRSWRRQIRRTPIYYRRCGGRYRGVGGSCAAS
jgi:acetate kinase